MYKEKIIQMLKSPAIADIFHWSRGGHLPMLWICVFHFLLSGSSLVAECNDCRLIRPVCLWRFYTKSLTHAHRPASHNLRKYALAGHDTVSHPLIDLTVIVTFLANLCQFQNHLIKIKSAAHRKGAQIRSFHDQIFSKSAEGDIRPLPAKFFDFFIR